LYDEKFTNDFRMYVESFKKLTSLVCGSISEDNTNCCPAIGEENIAICIKKKAKAVLLPSCRQQGGKEV
jgi:hypothetical protein